MVIFILMLIFHWIADFVLQSDRMAKSKSTDNKILAEHVLIYSLTMTCWFACTLLILESELMRWFMIIPFFIITFITHFLTDKVTSKINATLFAENRIHDLFVNIGLDQTIHIVTLTITLKFLI